MDNDAPIEVGLMNEQPKFAAGLDSFLLSPQTSYASVEKKELD